MSPSNLGCTTGSLGTTAATCRRLSKSPILSIALNPEHRLKSDFADDGTGLRYFRGSETQTEECGPRRAGGCGARSRPVGRTTANAIVSLRRCWLNLGSPYKASRRAIPKTDLN